METNDLPPFTPIETARLRLRHFQDSDLETLVAYRNDPDVARYQGWQTTTAEGLTEMIEYMAAQPGFAQGEWFQIAIEEKATGRHIGDIGVRLRPDNAQQGILGYTLAREAQGKGYATEAIGELLDYLFGTLNVHRVMADAFAENERSVRLLERLGFRREGLFREADWFEGCWVDSVIYALLRREWRGQKGDRNENPLPHPD